VLLGEGRVVIEQLLDSTVENLCSFCADDEERAALYGALEGMTRGELLDALTAETMVMLRERVAHPVGLVMTLS
jgi:hypothetical protein